MVWDSLAEFRGTSKCAIRHFVSVRTSVQLLFNPESPSHLHTQRSSQLFALSFPLRNDPMVLVSDLRVYYKEAYMSNDSLRNILIVSSHLFHPSLTPQASECISH